jgi:serine/threonine protein kinase
VTPSSQPPDPFVGRVLPGGLRVLERTGTTSEGPLYRAQYGQTGPLVALTLLRNSASHGPGGIPSVNEEHWLQLRRACQIRNPHVAGLLEVGRTPEGLVYAVAEFLTGELLSDMLSAGGTVPQPQAVDICLQAAEGLGAAHRVGVVHGGVSPQTILITPGDGEHLSVKLVRFDFSGYHADPGGSLDRSADPRYSGPERRAGHPLGPLDDVFSLGAVLHHLLTGVPPDTGSAMRAIPPALRRVVGRALAPARRRYSSVMAFAEDLAQAAATPTAEHRDMRRRLGWLVVAAALIAAVAWFGRKQFGTEGSELRNEVAVGAPDSLTDSPPSASPSETVSPAAPLEGPAPLEKPAPAPPPPTAPVSPPTSAPPKASVPPKQAAPDAPSPPIRPALPKSSTIPKGSASPNRPAPPKAAAPPAPSPGSVSRDSSATAVVSPFRRSHPWAARPDGRTYFPSSCRLAFESPDLVYFKTEAAARATGRSRSTEPGCS